MIHFIPGIETYLVDEYVMTYVNRENDRLPELRDDSEIVWKVLISDKSPLKIVIQRAVPELRKRMRWFGLGFLLAQLLLFTQWSTAVEEIPVFRKHKWILPFIGGFTAISVLLSQLFLIHENSHHSVFNPTSDIQNTRIVLIVTAFTITVIPFYQFVPMEVKATFPPNIPYFTVYSAASGLVAALITPYLSKLTWDYFRIQPNAATKKFAVFIGGVLLLFCTILIVGTWSSLIQLSPIEAVLAVATSSFVGGAFLIGVVRGLSDYQDGDAYVEDESNLNSSLASSLELFRTSNRLSWTMGFLGGLALPTVAGVTYIRTEGVGFEHLELGTVLIFGYLNLIVTTVFFVGVALAINAILAVLMWVINRVQ